MAADHVFDSAAEFETGEFTNCHAVDPSGKLTPGVSPETLAENVSENDLSVYLRCREGAGTAIENVGSAGNGTLTPGTWKTRADGRHYIQGGTVNVSYHASMKVAETDDNDDETKSYDWAAQIRVRFSSIAAAVFMQRSNRFQLGMDASGKPYIKNYYHISRVYNNKITLDAYPQDEWFPLSSSNLVNGSVTLTKDDGTSTGRTYEVDNTNGKIKFTSGGAYTGTIWIDYMHHEDSGWSEIKDDTALEVDTWYTIGAVCNGGSLTLYVNREAVATLSSVYCDNDPGTDLVAGFVGDWDAVMYSGNSISSNLVSFPSSGSWEKTISLAGDRAVRYLEMEVALGDEHSISVGITFDDDVDNLPYVDGWSYSRLVDGYNRIFPPEVGLYHGTKMLVKISISQGAYDREAVLVDYLKIHLREPATPIEEQTESPYTDLSLEDVTAEDLTALIREVQENRTVIKELSRSVVRLKEKAGRNLGGEGGGGGDPGGGSGQDADWAEEINRRLEANQLELWFWLPLIRQDHVHVGNLLQKQHFLDARRAVHWDHIMENMRDITVLQDAGYATEAYVTTAISDHAAIIGGTHGVSGAGNVIAGTDDIATHAALVTGVHGVGGNKVAQSSGTIITETQVSTHSGLTGGVHGISGAGNYVASTDNIATHASDTTAVHGITDTALLATLAIAAALDEKIDNHEADTTAIHGIANTGALATSTYVDNEIAAHEGSGTAHGSVESNFASHKDDGTNVHNVSIVAGLGDITSHSIDTTNVHGIADTSVLCTEPC